MARAFTVDPSCLSVSGHEHVLHGIKDRGIVSMTINTVPGLITFPEDDKWTVTVLLEPGENIFVLQGTDSADDTTPQETITLTLPSLSPTWEEYFNVFDEHSLIVGLRRNPGEKNWAFRKRLLAHATARTGSHLEGLFYAAALELGIKPTDRALGVRVARDAIGNTSSTNVNIEITPVYVYVDADELVQTREAHLVEPRYRGIFLNYTPRSAHEARMFDANDTEVSTNRFTVDGREIVLKDDDLNGTWVTFHYPYRARAGYRTLTLAQLQTALEAIMAGGQAIIEVAINGPTLPAVGLMRQGRQLLSRAWTHISHAHSQVTPLDSIEYQQSLLNRYGAAYGTKLERVARISAARSMLGWDNLILDEGLWDVEVENRALDFLPRLYDAVFGRWFCPHPGCWDYYDLDGYRKFGGHCPWHEVALEYIGTDEDLVTSGPVDKDGLYAIAEEVLEEL